MQKKAVVGVAVALVVLALIASIGFMNSGNVVNAANALEVSKVELTSLYHDVQQGGLGLRMNVAISNPTNTPVTLNNLRYFVSVNGLEIQAEGPSSVTVNPRSSSTVTVKARLDTSSEEGAKVAKEIFMTHEAVIGVGIVGEAPIKWFGVAKYSSTTVELSGNTTQNVGPLLGELEGNAVTASSPDLRVTSLKWVVDGKQANEVIEGKTVTLEFNIKALKDLRNYHLMICVFYDIKHYPDSLLKCFTPEVNVNSGEEKTVKVSFAANLPLYMQPFESYKMFRGFYAIIGKRHYSHWSGYYEIKPIYYNMPNHYPPRLKLIRAPESISVVGVKWYVNGHEVTEVHKGDHVTAVMTIKANTPIYNYKITYCVRADYKFLVDKNVKCEHTTLNIKQGETTTLSASFKAEHHWLLRGYFIQAYTTLRYGFDWTMPSHYPPRLKLK